ncbi:hypothetical protein [Vibrio parahaemolyticus]|uniref:hypothetical protein n=1 Tax=Vibrio parahaemolyticus TaxID=670 RepID=UPI0031FE5606
MFTVGTYNFMALTWIDVADTAIKIGLGSLITALSGLVILKKNQSHELNKNRLYMEVERATERKEKYVEFLAQSQALVQKYLNSSCSCQGDDYINYLRIYNEIQVISDDEIRLSAYAILCGVNEFIVINKSGLEREIRNSIRKNVDNCIGKMQKLAQLDIEKVRAMQT